MSPGLELLTTAEMAEADRLAVAAGVPFLTLMENAGRAVADEAARMVPTGARIAVLCGPGNNGGDGFVTARLLAERGYDVRVECRVDVADLTGDAAEMAARWGRGSTNSDSNNVFDVELIIDALFGAGLSRPMDEATCKLLTRFNGLGTPVLSIDVPSGLDGTTGQPMGPVVRASRTVTFFRKKPGHVSMPGRELCGAVVVADIGIPNTVLHDLVATTWVNDLDLWRHVLPSVGNHSHKYTRGHAIVVSGPPHATGAARLGARGALRVGAGLVTVAAPLTSVAANAVHLTAIMIAPFAAPDGLTEVLADTRRNAVLIGPGCGVGAQTRRMVEIALAAKVAVVLDADALTSFTPEKDEVHALKGVGFLGAAAATNAGKPSALFAMIAAEPEPTVDEREPPVSRPRQVVLTPHEGELDRKSTRLNSSHSS